MKKSKYDEKCVISKLDRFSSVTLLAIGVIEDLVETQVVISTITLFDPEEIRKEGTVYFVLGFLSLVLTKKEFEKSIKDGDSSLKSV